MLESFSSQPFAHCHDPGQICVKEDRARSSVVCDRQDPRVKPLMHVLLLKGLVVAYNMSTKELIYLHMGDFRYAQGL